MSRIKTYLLGRDPSCDYHITENTVSRRHAEVIFARDGRFYVTDRGSTSGTFVLTGGEWKSVRQSYVEPTARIRFGRYEMAAARLMALREDGSEGQPLSGRSTPERVKTPVRNPETAEIVDDGTQ